MRRRKLLGSLTIMAAIPPLAFIIFVTTIYKAPFTHFFVIEKIVIVICCVIGGVLLWQGKKWGYGLSAIGWLVILCASICGIYVAFQPDTNVATRSRMLLQNGISVAVGIPVIVILIRDIIGRKKA